MVTRQTGKEPRKSPALWQLQVRLRWGRPVAQVAHLSLHTTFGHKADILLVGQRVGLLGPLDGWGCGGGPSAIHPIEHEPWPGTAERGGDGW